VVVTRPARHNPNSCQATSPHQQGWVTAGYSIPRRAGFSTPWSEIRPLGLSCPSWCLTTKTVANAGNAQQNPGGAALAGSVGMKVLLPDQLRALIEPLLPTEPAKPQGGCPRIGDRACLTGILFVLKTGIRGSTCRPSWAGVAS
jgi:hypothetical protein